MPKLFRAVNAARLHIVCGLTCIALQFSVQAGAYAAEPAMSFSFERTDFNKYGLGLYRIIHASGAITDSTYDQLKVFVAENRIPEGSEIYLESTTGNRLEGMRLGRLIRSLKLNTHIGNTDANVAGSCISACAFAYLGGVYRFMNKSALYGVHSFYRSQGQYQEFTFEQTQDIAKRMTDYMGEMGVSPTLFKYMTATDKADVLMIDKPTLQGLRVVNDGVISANITLEQKDGVEYIHGSMNDYRGHHTLDLMCDRQQFTLRGDATYEIARPESHLRVVEEQGVYIGEFRKPVNGQVQINENNITFKFPMAAELARDMANAYKIGIYLKPGSDTYTLGYQIVQSIESKDIMKKYINNCYGKQLVTN